jgi:N-acyl-D-aspartate/D-glutamate deacylase
VKGDKGVEKNFDLILKNGTIVDGSGNGAFTGDIGVAAGRIAAIGVLDETKADLTVDLHGQVVTPGFVDIHTHADTAVITVPGAENYIYQGVTAVVGGNCGEGEDKLSIRSHLERVQKVQPAVNYGVLVGHGNVRKEVMEDVTDSSTEAHREKMLELMETAMQEGALGISSGLEYWSDRCSSKEELIDAAKTAARYGGIYATHMRDEQAGVITSLGEAIEVARIAKAPVQVSHLKACGAAVWGSGKILISMLTMARALGVDIMADQYPYGASSTGFGQCFPAWALAGGIEELQKRLADPVQRQRIRSYGESQIRVRVGDDLSLIQISHYDGDPQLDGKRVSEILQDRGLEPSMEHGLDLITEMFLHKDPSIIYHYIDEQDIQTILRSPYVMVVSDGHICRYGESIPHPRSYGAFPRVLARYVRDMNIITLEEAVRKMTSLPADRFRIRNRGRIKVGYWADIAVFPLEEIQDRATFQNPHQYAHGITHVLVNGEFALKDGALTGRRSGSVLMGPGMDS